MTNNIKWVKITTDMFNNRKIIHLRKLPAGNDIVLIWCMLLTMAGRCNANGMIFLTENIPYTTKMLADELQFEENTIMLALNTLEQFNMIIRDGDYFTIAGWEEYQNIEGMDRIREQNRLRKQKQREKQKQVLLTDGNNMSRDTSRDVTQQNKNKKENKNKNIELENKKETRHKYGEYNNVLLTDNDFEKLKTEFPNDYLQRIEKLSSYMESTGKTYKNHLATIRNWARKDKEKETPNTKTQYDGFNFNKFDVI